MKQTAVEWLESELDFLSNYMSERDRSKLFEQAKQMEKKQIIDAVVWFDDTERRPFQIEIDAEQYYNETYKTK